jgi:heterodisulfide reductase subunit D
MLSRLQLDGQVLERLGQKSASAAVPVEAPDFVFYTGCNVLKTPHIALLTRSPEHAVRETPRGSTINT